MIMGIIISQYIDLYYPHASTMALFFQVIFYYFAKESLSIPTNLGPNMFWFTFFISIEELQMQATGHLKTDLSMEESGTKEDFVSVQRHWPMGNVFFFISLLGDEPPRVFRKQQGHLSLKEHIV